MLSVFDQKETEISCDIPEENMAALKIRVVFLGANRKEGEWEAWTGRVRFVDPNFSNEVREYNITPGTGMVSYWVNKNTPRECFFVDKRLKIKYSFVKLLFLNITHLSWKKQKK